MRTQTKAGFTLIEMLAVIAIIAIVVGFVVPAATSMMRGSQMTQAANTLVDQLSLARQRAVSQGVFVEVRFIRFANPETPGEVAGTPSTGQFRAIQLMQVYSSGIPAPLGEVQILPSTIVINNQGGGGTPISSLVLSSYSTSTDPTLPIYAKARNTDPEMPRGVARNYDYYAFRFQPDGSTTLAPAQNWYVTLTSINDLSKATSSASLQKINFFTVQVDPASGATRTYRPIAI